MPGFLETEHEKLRVLARAKVAGWHDEAPTDAALKARVDALGFFGYLVPRELGGVNARIDVRSLCVLREELAYRDAAADSVFAVQGLGSHPVMLAGTPVQQSALLPGILSGKHLFAFALTEPNAGSDVAALSTRATRESDGYVLSGDKRFISNAGIATHYTVFARTGDGPKGISAFVIDAQTPGFHIDSSLELLGKHPIGTLRFEGCRIPTSARLGNEGDGMKLALATLDTFRPTVGAAAVGMAKRAQDEAIAYVQKRQQFGAPLAELQGVQFLLAENAVELEAATLLVHQAASVKDAGQARITYEAAVAKLFATEAAQRIVDRSLQLHGGNGLVKGHIVERLYRDVRALRIYEGASEVQKLVIGRHLLKERPVS
jgi:acyl-CoA dehydrogenase